jgi:bifunctional DNA-binding transcriptional regulator/antitoxin component of YhaV-PrlF toxin-antitoxin module
MIRKLKIYYNKNNKPQIVLQGEWLEKAGYKVGDKIEVKIIKNKITIKKEPD